MKLFHCNRHIIQSLHRKNMRTLLYWRIYLYIVYINVYIGKENELTEWTEAYTSSSKTKLQPPKSHSADLSIAQNIIQCIQLKRRIISRAHSLFIPLMFNCSCSCCFFFCLVIWQFRPRLKINRTPYTIYRNLNKMLSTRQTICFTIRQMITLLLSDLWGMQLAFEFFEAANITS